MADPTDTPKTPEMVERVKEAIETAFRFQRVDATAWGPNEGIFPSINTEIVARAAIEAMRTLPPEVITAATRHWLRQRFGKAGDTGHWLIRLPNETEEELSEREEADLNRWLPTYEKDAKEIFEGVIDAALKG